MKYFLIIITLFLLSTIGLAQDPLDPGWLWAERGGSSGSLIGASGDAEHERIIDIAIDNENNYYFLAEVGGFTFTYDTMEFENYNNDPGKKDLFVFSTDSEGDYRWSKLIGGGTYDFASSLGIDAEGNVYVSGSCTNFVSPITAVHFDTDSILNNGTINPSAANKKIFIIKYNMDGNFQWLRQPEGNETPIGASGVMLKMVVEPDGTTHNLMTLLEGSYFNGQVIIPPADSINNVNPAHSVIVKYNSEGEFEDYILIDMKPLTGIYNYQFAYDPNLERYYIADTYRSIFIEPDNPLSINGYGADTPNKAFYLAAVDNQGEVVWYHENEKIGAWSIGDLEIDDSGNIYLTGYLGIGAGPDNFAGYQFDIEPSEQYSPFLVKLDADGNLLWGTNSEEYSPWPGQSIVISDNNVYLGLSMLLNTWDDVDIPAPTGQGLVPDIQIIRFDAQTGMAQEAISNNETTPTRDAIMAMALDTAGALVVGGYFGSTLFGGTDLQIQDTGPDSDFFIAKYQPQNTGVGINEASALNSVKVYPNPTSGMLNLQGKVALTSYTLCDLQGRVVKQGNIESNQVDLSRLESGVYVLGVVGVDGGVWNLKVDKRQKAAISKFRFLNYFLRNVSPKELS